MEISSSRSREALGASIIGEEEALAFEPEHLDVGDFLDSDLLVIIYLGSLLIFGCWRAPCDARFKA